MNNFILSLVIAVILCCFCFACNNKSPPIDRSLTGTLVIPLRITNKTQYNFAYYYRLLYSPIKWVTIEIQPVRGKEFCEIEYFPAGEYAIHSVKTISSPSHRITADTSSRVRVLRQPIYFEIKAEQKSLLNHNFIIKSEYLDPFNARQGRQYYKFEPASGKNFERGWIRQENN